MEQGFDMNAEADYKQRIFITGANGFIGKNTRKQLLKDGFYVISGVRQKSLDESFEGGEHRYFDLASSSSTDLCDVDVVIHLAGIAHKFSDVTSQEFFEGNCDATLALANTAVKLGVKRFIFLSSIGVHGASSAHLLTEESIPKPHNHYALSKLHAEMGLLDIALKSEMEVVIIRPPLVYGRGAPGNFSKLVRLLRRGLPLPFGGVNNKRSFCGVDNLVSFLSVCSNVEQTPLARNQIFLIADDEVVSTPAFLTRISDAIHNRSCQIALPVVFLSFLFRLVGQHNLVESLILDLTISTAKADLLLGWKPVFSMEEQLAEIDNW